ncbi:MAG: hypothetical protein HC893_05195 [Chloroflexaceae bacterium]|nr:hypothetical protein [Chloroflexaceae bacterium]
MPRQGGVQTSSASERGVERGRCLADAYLGEANCCRAPLLAEQEQHSRRPHQDEREGDKALVFHGSYSSV